MFIEPPCKAEKESHESIIGGALARTKGHEKRGEAPSKCSACGDVARKL